MWINVRCSCLFDFLPYLLLRCRWRFWNPVLCRRSERSRFRNEFRWCQQRRGGQGVKSRVSDCFFSPPSPAPLYWVGPPPRLPCLLFPSAGRVWEEIHLHCWFLPILLSPVLPAVKGRRIEETGRWIKKVPLARSTLAWKDSVWKQFVLSKFGLGGFGSGLWASGRLGTRERRPRFWYLSSRRPKNHSGPGSSGLSFSPKRSGTSWAEWPRAKSRPPPQHSTRKSLRARVLCSPSFVGVQT